MDPHFRVPAGARRAATGNVGGRPTLSAAERLTKVSDRLDSLVRDVTCSTARSHRETERRIAEAEDIATEIRAIFRAPSTPRHPPLSGKSLY